MSPYTVEFSRPAQKQLSKLPETIRKKIYARIESLGDNPRPEGCKKLVGAEPLYRLREGDYRIIYQVEDQVLTILVIRIGHRREVYR
ncbi:MAG: type II toxin-antitoxin system RelE family toxin [Acidobacteriota bacterium]